MRRALGLAVTAMLATYSQANAGTGAPETSQAASPAAPADIPNEYISLFMGANRPLVMMRVGEHSPFPVVFDTGTNGNLLDLALADRLGLPNTGPSESTDGQGDPVPGHQILLSHASVSGVAIPAGKATAAAYDLPNEVGVIGPDSFEGRLVKVELAKSLVTLSSRSEANTPRCAAYPYSSAFSFANDKTDTLPTVPIKIGGSTIIAEVDTGNDQGIILPTSLIPSLPLESKPVAVGYSQSVVGREPVLEGRLAADVSIGGVVLRHADVLFMAAHKPNVGLDILRRFTLVFDPLGQRDWLIPVGSDAVTCLPGKAAAKAG